MRRNAGHGLADTTRIAGVQAKLEIAHANSSDRSYYPKKKGPMTRAGSGAKCHFLS
jgi:hypothetical protein